MVGGLVYFNVGFVLVKSRPTIGVADSGGREGVPVLRENKRFVFNFIWGTPVYFSLVHPCASVWMLPWHQCSRQVEVVARVQLLSYVLRPDLPLHIHLPHCGASGNRCQVHEKDGRCKPKPAACDMGVAGGSTSA